MTSSIMTPSSMPLLPTSTTALDTSALSTLAAPGDTTTTTTFAAWLALDTPDTDLPTAGLLPTEESSTTGAPILTPPPSEQDTDTTPDSPWPPDGLSSLWLPTAPEPAPAIPSTPEGAAMADTPAPANTAPAETTDLPGTASIPAATGEDLKASLTPQDLPHLASVDSPRTGIDSLPSQHSALPGQATSAFLPQATQAPTAPGSLAPPTEAEPDPFAIQAALRSAEEPSPTGHSPEETGIKPISIPTVAFSPPPAAAPMPAPSTAPFPAPDVHADTFPDTLGSHIQWLAEQKIGHAHLQLHPQELGQLEVRLKLDGDQLHADFSSAQSEVRQALEHALPRLRDLLGEHGLHLAQADVNQQHAQPHQPAAAHTGLALDGEFADDSSPAPSPVLHSTHLLDAYA